MHSGGWLYHIGKYMVMLGDLFVKPERFNMYWKESLRQMQQIGVGSLIIILIISVFIGAVTSWQLAYNLRDSFVPMVYVGYIVKESMILELAPTISCLLLAGKVGSNVASELGTMRLTEQIDALEIMGVNTTAYLVGPKIIAALIMIPFLVIISAAMGIWGGMISVGLSGLVSYQEFTQGAQTSFVAFNITVMIIKAATFGFLLTSIACYQGYYAYGGALDIGKASTRAVVISCILILITDFALAWMLL
jgi:phospholipid/cholesterol/gamma-HCH transport system permease protein